MLTKAKRKAIEQRLRDDPGQSNRAIATALRVSHSTVAAIRGEFGDMAKSAISIDRKPSIKRIKPQTTAAIPELPAINGKAMEINRDEAPTGDNPAAILREIAGDPRAPATARVQAAKALLAMQKPSSEDKAAEKVDRVTQRALQLISGGRE